MLELDREQVMAYRISAQGLHRDSADPADAAVLDLGVQDNQRDGAAMALAARLDDPVVGSSLAEDDRFTLAWSYRGAPHLHRAQHARLLSRALVPASEEDAGARTGWQRGQVADSGISTVEAIMTTARAIHTAVDGVMTKGAASTIVSRIVPAGLTGWCRGCQATHVYEQLMRLAALIGGVRLVMGATPATLAPLEDDHPRPAEPDRVGATAIVAAYLRLHGPATASEAAGFLGTTRNTTAALCPADLAEVRVEGVPAFVPSERLRLLENPPEPELVRLLPPMDPLLQARDRTLIVPDRAQHKEVWKVLGNPGTILSGGEIVGTWRGKSAGRRLAVSLNPFRTLRESDRAAIDREAQLIARVRGFESARVQET